MTEIHELEWKKRRINFIGLVRFFLFTLVFFPFLWLAWKVGGGKL